MFSGSRLQPAGVPLLSSCTGASQPCKPRAPRGAGTCRSPSHRRHPAETCNTAGTAGQEGSSCSSERLCAHSSDLVLPSHLISLPFLPQKEHVSFISCCLLTIALHGVVCFCVWWLSLYGKCEKHAARLHFHATLKNSVTACG